MRGTLAIIFLVGAAAVLFGGLLKRAVKESCGLASQFSSTTTDMLTSGATGSVLEREPSCMNICERCSRMSSETQ